MDLISGKAHPGAVLTGKEVAETDDGADPTRGTTQELDANDHGTQLQRACGAGGHGHGT